MQLAQAELRTSDIGNHQLRECSSSFDFVEHHGRRAGLFEVASFSKIMRPHQHSGDRIEIPANSSGSITFTGELGGAAVSKRIEMRGDSYEWALDANVSAPPAGYTELALGWEEGMNPAGPNAAEVVFDTIVVLQNDKLTRDVFTGLDAGKLIEGNVTWLAFVGPVVAGVMLMFVVRIVLV